MLSTVLEPAPLGGIAAAGTIEPQFKTELSFRTLGRLITRPVNVGDLVDEGQVVGTIDATTLEFAVRSARAEVSKAEAQHANASATEERQRILIARDATTRAVLDSAEQGRASAEAAVARGQANLTKAREQLGYAQLKADFAGVVTAVKCRGRTGGHARPERADDCEAGYQGGRGRSRSGFSRCADDRVCRSASALRLFPTPRLQGKSARSPRWRIPSRGRVASASHWITLLRPSGSAPR